MSIASGPIRCEIRDLKNRNDLRFIALHRQAGCQGELLLQGSQRLQNLVRPCLLVASATRTAGSRRHHRRHAGLGAPETRPGAQICDAMEHGVAMLCGSIHCSTLLQHAPQDCVTHASQYCTAMYIAALYRTIIFQHMLQRYGAHITTQIAAYIAMHIATSQNI